MTDGSGLPALSVREVGFGSAILTMFLVSLAVWRSSQFKDQGRSRAGWAGSGWWAGLYLIPLAVLTSLPWTIQWMSGRAFDFTSLALAMLDFVISLGAATVLCCISAGVQIARRLTSCRQRER
jgi:hypothetical protein